MGLFEIVIIMAVISAVLASVVWYKEKNIIESTVMGMVLFFCTYIVGSMGLFVIDKFSLFRAAGVTLILDAALLLAAVLLRKSRPFSIKKLFRCDMSLRSVIIPIVVCLVALPFVSVKNELFGMGQDQGVYQIQAIGFMYGDNLRQKDFDEYHKLDTQEERESFEYCVRNALRGYDIPHEVYYEAYPESAFDENVSEVSGLIHGIPTFSAMLAMWGTIFGMENMFGVETVFFALMIFMVYFVCCNMKLKKSTALCACVMAALSPVVIWTAKSSLTEMFLTLLPLMFAYFMTDEQNPSVKWFSISAVVVFGCYHVSIYTMIPMFFIIYAGMYFFTRKKQFAWLMPATAVVYLLSFLAMQLIQPVYTLNNYSPVFAIGIDQHSVPAFVYILCAGLVAASAVFVFIVSRSNKKFDKKTFNVRASENRFFRVFMILLIALPVTYIALRAFTKYGSWDEASHLTLIGFFGNAGIVLIPLALIGGAVFVKHIIQDNSRIVMFVMFFYCVLIYSAFLRYEIQYYFYYSRYIGPFVPVAVIFAVMVFDRFGGKLLYPAALAGLAFNIPYNLNLLTAKDDTRMEWEILEDITDKVTEGDCIVIERKYMDHLWLPLDTLTTADVYPAEEKLEDQLTELSTQYGRVLLVTADETGSEYYRPVYLDRIAHSEDDLARTGDIIPMPEKYWETTDNICVYSYEKYRFRYTPVNDYIRFSGLSVLEGDFCWTTEETVGVECRLYPDDYEMKLNFGCGIPFDEIGKESLDVTVCINGEEAGTETIDASNNGAELSFDIPEELIIDGDNTVSLETKLWNASDVNPDDVRILGIPIKSIEFSLSEN